MYDLFRVVIYHPTPDLSAFLLTRHKAHPHVQIFSFGFHNDTICPIMDDKSCSAILPLLFDEVKRLRDVMRR